MKKLLRDQKGSILLEFTLVFNLYMAIILMLIIHGLWLYNNFQADRAARQAAYYLGTTNNGSIAEDVAVEYLSKTQIATTVKDVSVYWSGRNAAARVHVDMKTFFPGIPKLLNPKNANWVGSVPIVKEAISPGEYHHTNSSEYN